MLAPRKKVNKCISEQHNKAVKAYVFHLPANRELEKEVRCDTKASWLMTPNVCVALCQPVLAECLSKGQISDDSDHRNVSCKLNYSVWIVALIREVC